MPINYTQSPSTLIVPISSTLNYQVCSLNPSSWDIRFNLFFTCLCGLITLITLSSFVYIECNRCVDSTRSTPKSKMLPNSRISSFGDLANDNLGSNEAIATNTNNGNSKYHHSPGSMGTTGSGGVGGGGGGSGSSGVGVGVGGGVANNSGINGIALGSHNSLQRFYSISKEDSVNSHHPHHLISNHSLNHHPSHHQNPHHNGTGNILNHIRSSDMRWAVVVAITSLSYAINQGPSLIFMFVGMIVPHFWTPLHDNVITWFALIEGFLLPILLYLTDENFRDAVRLSFRRHSSTGSRSCSTINPEKFKPSPNGFTFHYNDFVLIDKPYLGLMKSSEAKRSPSTLNLVSSSTSRSPYPGRHLMEAKQSPPSQLKSPNGRPKGSSPLTGNGKSPSGLFAITGIGGHSKGNKLGRKSSQLSHIMFRGELSSKKQQQQQQQQLGLTPFFSSVGHNNSTLNSNLTRSDDSIRKEKIPSSLTRLSPMAWSINNDNWHFSSTVDRKLASAMELNVDNVEESNMINDDDDKGCLIGNKNNHGKRKGENNIHNGNHYSKKERPIGAKMSRGDDEFDDDDGEHIYATLKVRSVGDSNSDYGCKDNSLAVKQLPQESSVFEDDASVSRLSFTTNANDDFEFHDTRESAIYAKPYNFNVTNGINKVDGKHLDEESGDSTSSGEDGSIITSDSCSSSDSDSDNQQIQQKQQQHLHSKLSSSNYIANQLPLLLSSSSNYHQLKHPNHRHYSSQLLLAPNQQHHFNHLQLDKGDLYVSKTANLITANPMLAYHRNKSRSSSQIVATNPNGTDSLFNGNGEEKRRGWQFFSASDLHLLDNNKGPSATGKENRSSIPSKQDSHFINPLSNHYYYANNGLKTKSPFDGQGFIETGAIGSRRTMSETNLSPGRTVGQFIHSQQQQQQHQQQQQLIYGSRDAGLYHLNRSTHNRIHLPFDPNYPLHHHHQHDTNTSNSTNSSGSSFGTGDHVNHKRFANIMSTNGNVNGDRKGLERISSFSKNRPRIRAQKYQLHRRTAAGAKRQESIKELSVDYRRNCIGSRLSLAQQDMSGAATEPLGAFVSVKSMPDLTINSYLPIYNQLSSIKQ